MTPLPIPASGSWRRKAAFPHPSPAGCQKPGGGAPPEVTAVVPSHQCAAAALLAVPKERCRLLHKSALGPHAGRARPRTGARPNLLRAPFLAEGPSPRRSHRLRAGRRGRCSLPTPVPCPPSALGSGSQATNVPGRRLCAQLRPGAGVTRPSPQRLLKLGPGVGEGTKGGCHTPKRTK